MAPSLKTTILFVIAGFTTAVSAAQPSLTFIQPPANGVTTRINDVNSNGLVVGYSVSVDSNGFPINRGFEWTPQSGRLDYGLSSNLATIRPLVVTEGNSVRFGGGVPSATRYTNSSDIQPLGLIGNSYSIYVNDASNDGTVATGFAQYEVNEYRPFRWTASGGFQDMGHAAPFQYTVAEGMSGDGNTIVGNSGFNDGAPVAFRWRPETGYQLLSSVGGTFNLTQAFNVSRDGQVTVGNANIPDFSNTVPVRWTEDGTCELLGVPGEFWGGTAKDVNSDGSIIVGHGAGPTTPTARGEAFIWRQGEGIMRLANYLEGEFGITLPSGWELRTCDSISADGRVMAGIVENRTLRRNMAYVITIPSPGTALIAFGALAWGARRRRA